MHASISTPLRIQPVQSGEWSLLRDFAEQTFRTAWQDDNEPDEFEAYCRQAFTLEKFHAERAVPGAEFYLVWLDDAAVAYLKLNAGRLPEPWDGGAALQLERIYVDVRYQSAGFGAALLDFTETRARETGAEWVWLSVWQKSPRSIVFYQRNGYEIFGVETFWIGNDPQPDWLMRKKLVVRKP